MSAFGGFDLSVLRGFDMSAFRRPQMSAFANSSRITPFLWFDANAEEAVEFYCGIFPNSRRLSELRNTGDAPGPKGGVLTISFELDGQRFTALNGRAGI